MLLFQKLSQEVRNACIEVQSVLGTGLLENCYEEALIYELGLRGIECKSQVPIIVSYKDKVIGKYFADVLVEPTVNGNVSINSNIYDKKKPSTPYVIRGDTGLLIY